MAVRQRVSTGSSFEDLAGYSRAVAVQDWVFVAGTTGVDYATGEISDDPVEQTEQIFRTVGAALAEVGARLEDVVKVEVWIADRDDFQAVAGVLGRHFRDILPTNATVVSGLADPRMKVEIAMTAYRPGN